ncbi:hypothetical protein [Occallatibacter savannae]|uniref:hypothetical protein n=1 Tax=Occallatibacter savannae TaxID=1002691 RepID=UPI0013A58575|nr:hypothetical protein [Occallatibacter savannae]
MTSAAGQISSSSQSVAQGSSEQAASIEETSASSEEINSIARRNAESAKQAEALVRKSELELAEMNGHLETMVTAMSDIKESSDHVSQTMEPSTRSLLKPTSWPLTLQ